MDAYHPSTVSSSIDHYGRYAYANQPAIAHWNLAGLASCLVPLLGDDEEKAIAEANAAVFMFPKTFKRAYQEGLWRKLGLCAEQGGDHALAQDLLDRMSANKADFTLTFRHLCEASADPGSDAAVRRLFNEPGSYDHGRYAGARGWRATLKALRNAGLPCVV